MPLLPEPEPQAVTPVATAREIRIAAVGRRCLAKLVMAVPSVCGMRVPRQWVACGGGHGEQRRRAAFGRERCDGDACGAGG
ncbi:hypothetical protein TUSST3_07470 [Streptomyces sp. TUS-ST3]|nr:hypothetical protein TUSST3_07470 [Streptomyces sp. TUS-ST3]